jgi:hypothetical protein
LDALTDEIGATDLLGRRIDSSTEVKKARKQIRSYVFVDSEPTLSVDRLDLAPDIEVAAIADSERESGRTFYGWAVVSAEIAQRNGRAVVATPTEHNRFHADITLPETSDREERLQHAVELASNAAWRPRPS